MMHRSELYAAFILCTVLVSPSTAIRVRATSEGTLKRILVKDQIRGGGSYIQSNPNYNDSDPNQFLPPMLGDLDKNQTEDLISTPTTTTATTTATINTRLAHKDNRSRLHKSSRNSFSSFVYQVLLFSMEQFPPYSFLYSGRYRNSQQFSAKTLSAVNIISHKDATIHSSRASFHIQPYHTSS